MNFIPERKNKKAILGGVFLAAMVLCSGCATNTATAQAFGAKGVTKVSYHPPRTLERADQIVVYKSKRQMYLLKDGHILRKYRVALGKKPVGHKLEWGDMRTPEGKYTIDWKNPDSQYYRSLRISYPDAGDSDVAAALDTNPGNLIMIHGQPNGGGTRSGDWTNGCIAVTNEEMTEIWQMVKVGTKISIWP